MQELSPQQEATLRNKVIDEKIANEQYLRAHPEIAAVLSEVIRQVVLRRPKAPVAYVEDFLATTDLQKLYQTICYQQEHQL